MKRRNQAAIALLTAVCLLAALSLTALAAEETPSVGKLAPEVANETPNLSLRNETPSVGKLAPEVANETPNISLRNETPSVGKLAPEVANETPNISLRNETPNVGKPGLVVMNETPAISIRSEAPGVGGDSADGETAEVLPTQRAEQQTPTLNALPGGPVIICANLTPIGET